MTIVSLLRRFAVGGGALVLAAASVQAQVAPNKPPPRLPPNPTEASRIPAGVDTGSPATSDALPLGTPVPPVAGADRNEMRNRSAAARAAARPRLAAAPVDSATADRVPAGPAVIGARTDSRNPAATPNATTAPARAATPRPTRPASASRAASAAPPVKSSMADCKPGQVAVGAAETDAPVALPGSGFVGSSASPSTAAAVGRGGSRTSCV